MTMWDLSDRAVLGQLARRAATDAQAVVEEMWPDHMPQDFQKFASERTDDFLAESVAIPRRLFTSGEQAQAQMRYYRNEIGNWYYWTFLRALVEAVIAQIRINLVLPRHTIPPAQQHPAQHQEGA